MNLQFVTGLSYIHQLNQIQFPYFKSYKNSAFLNSILNSQNRDEIKKPF